jgi:hypothetical protein
MNAPIQTPAPVVITDPAGYGRFLTNQFIPNQYAAATLNSASGTSEVTLVTAPAFYFVTVLQITIDPTCTIAAAGMVSIAVTDSVSGNTVGMLRVYIPSAVTAPGIATVIRQVNAPGFFWSSPQANSTLQVALNTALTAGSIRVSVGYGLTSVFIGNVQ